jgi:hypothetical protein
VSSENASPEKIERALRASVPNLPKIVRFRAQNALDHIDRAHRLLDTDRAIASFCAITAQEEAAAALFSALQYQSYPRSDELQIRDHNFKAALVPFLDAVQMSLSQGFQTVDVQFDPTAPKIRVSVPLYVEGVPRFRLELVDPLDLYATRGGRDGAPDAPEDYGDQLSKLATLRGSKDIRKMVAQLARQRNSLLYASDGSLPVSRASPAVIDNRKKSVLLILGLVIGVLQTATHQGLAVRGIEVLLQIVKRIPKERNEPSAPA